MCENDECLLQVMSGQPAASHGNWYYVWSEFDIFTNYLEEGINGPLMKSTDEVEWWIRCKKAKKLVILVKWDATCGNAHSSLKQEITIWKSFNGTNQSRKYQCQQRPGAGAGEKIRQRWDAEPEQLKLLSGKISGHLASVHVLPPAPDTQPESLNHILLLPSGQPVLSLLALAGEESSRWPPH